MFPILLSIGGIHLYSFSVAIILAWLVFSFLFWRGLRNAGVPEERIFDLTFYATITAFVLSRLGYVATNWELFAQAPIKIAAIWITPGMSLYGALLGALLPIISLSRRYKVRVGQVLDAFGPAFGASFIVGEIGGLLDGTYVGTATTLPWAVRYVGHLGTRHPVQVYEIIVAASICMILGLLAKRAEKRKWPYGLLGLWFFALFSVSMFILEFLKDTHVYLGHLRANQWVLIALFAETMGAFYVRGGGREQVRPAVNKIGRFFSNIFGGIYGKFSQRRS